MFDSFLASTRIHCCTIGRHAQTHPWHPLRKLKSEDRLNNSFSSLYFLFSLFVSVAESIILVARCIKPSYPPYQPPRTLYLT